VEHSKPLTPQHTHKTHTTHNRILKIPVPRYRSAIYYYNKDQKTIIDKVVKAYQEILNKKGKGKIATEVELADTFYYAEEYHQQYDAKPGSRQYCGLRPLGISFPDLSPKE